MKRYLLFMGLDYYPAGGWDDLRDSFDTVSEAESSAKTMMTRFNWWHVVDKATGEKVSEI